MTISVRAELVDVLRQVTGRARPVLWVSLALLTGGAVIGWLAGRRCAVAVEHACQDRHPGRRRRGAFQPPQAMGQLQVEPAMDQPKAELSPS